ncbi:hypothetical protein ACA910_016615 [Epithemia clementina (nom. ined.)]
MVPPAPVVVDMGYEELSDLDKRHERRARQESHLRATHPCLLSSSSESNHSSLDNNNNNNNKTEMETMTPTTIPPELLGALLTTQNYHDGRNRHSPTNTATTTTTTTTPLSPPSKEDGDNAQGQLLTPKQDNRSNNSNHTVHMMVTASSSSACSQIPTTTTTTSENETTTLDSTSSTLAPSTTTASHQKKPTTAARRRKTPAATTTTTTSAFMVRTSSASSCSSSNSSSSNDHASRCSLRRGSMLGNRPGDMSHPKKEKKKIKPPPSKHNDAENAEASASSLPHAMDGSGSGSGSSIPDAAHALITLALQLTSQDWSQLGLQNNSRNNNDGEDNDKDNDDDKKNNENTNMTLQFSDLVDRLTALLLVRFVALAARPGTFADLSTTTICRTVLVQPEETWPARTLTPSFLHELQTYVHQILSWYRPYVPYHNAEHAYHVTMSTNKLLDIMLSKSYGQKSLPPLFGLRQDPLRLLCMIWAALIHDVDHCGVPNRQLATEQIDHSLAIRYNDQSIAENQSLFLAFDELLHGTSREKLPPKNDGTTTTTTTTSTSPKPLYENLRKVLCPTDRDYFTFRKHLINLVLHTDIASPEKAELSKSKFKAANFEGSQPPSHQQQEQQHPKNNSVSSSEHGDDNARPPRRRQHRHHQPRRKNGASNRGGYSTRKHNLSRSISNTLHNADYRLAPPERSESEMSSDMSYDDTTESSEVSCDDNHQKIEENETQIAVTTATAAMSTTTRPTTTSEGPSKQEHQLQPRKGNSSSSNNNTNNNNRNGGQPTASSPHGDNSSSSSNYDGDEQKQPFCLANAMKHGVQVTVKTASASKLNFTQPHTVNGGILRSTNNGTVAAAPSNQNSTIIGVSSNNNKNMEKPIVATTTPQRAKASTEDTPFPPHAKTPATRNLAPDKIPAVPQRRLSTATTSAAISSETAPSRFTTVTAAERPKLAIKTDKSVAAAVVATASSLGRPDRTPAVPRRRLSQEDEPLPSPAPSVKNGESCCLPSAASASSSEQQQEPPKASAVPSSPDASTETATEGSTGSDRTPLVPQRRDSVASRIVMEGLNDSREEGVPKPVVSTHPVVAEQTPTSSLAAKADITTSATTTERNARNAPQMPTTNPSSPTVGDKTPAFPQRRLSNAIDQKQPIGETETAVKLNPLVVAEKTTEKAKNTIADAPSGSDRTPNFPQRRLTAAAVSTTNSLSMTPEDKISLDAKKQSFKMNHTLSDSNARAVTQRRLSGGFIGSKHSAVSQESRRRHSSGLDDRKKNVLKRKKLGLRRSMDWSGEMLQPYLLSSFQQSLSDDKPDELKASVVMETIIAVADVSQNVQSFDNMVKWSNKLFMELRRAHAAGRGPDVSQNWFRNQIGFLEHYVLPLTKKLDETGAFGPVIGPSFARLVEANRDRWLLDGEKVTADVIKAGEQAFPDGTPMPKEECTVVDPRVERFLKQADDQRPPIDTATDTANTSDKLPLPDDSIVGFSDSNTASRRRVERKLHEVQKRLKGVVNDHEREIANIASNHNSRVDELERELEEMTEEYDRARSKISKLTEERDEARRSANLQTLKESELTILQEKLRSVVNENESMKKRLELLTRQGKEDNTFFMLERLQLLDERESLRSSLRELISHHTNEESRLESIIVALENELSTMDSNILKAKVKDTHNTLSEMKKEKTTIDKTLHILRIQYDEETKKIEVERHRLVQAFDSSREQLTETLNRKSKEPYEVAPMRIPFDDEPTAVVASEHDSKDGARALLSHRELDESFGTKQVNPSGDSKGIYSELKELLVLHQKQSLQLHETIRLQIQEKAESRAQNGFLMCALFVGAFAIGMAFATHSKH